MLRFVLRLVVLAGLFRTQDAAEVAAKWVRRGQGASQDYADGVDRVTESPTAAAARQKDKWIQAIQQAAQDGRFERGLNRVSLDDWKRAAREKGSQNYAPGVAAAEAKMVRAMERVLPLIDQTRQEIRSMPSTTVDQRIQRATAFMTGLHRRARSQR